MEPYGVHNTAMYTGFAILLAYATHGWFVTHVNQKVQFQRFDSPTDIKAGLPPKRYVDREPPAEAAVRTAAALLTSMIVYTFVPFAPATFSFCSFVGWTMAFSIYWDFHFFIVHKAAHESRWMYTHVHKLHHTHKQPGPFTAYFVTYISHFLTEQSVVLIGAAAGLPRNVFTWIMWYGTLATYIEHCGHDIADVKLSPLPITYGQLGLLLNPWTLLLGSQSTAMHDWHHEKFTTNYALSFGYLDKLLGSYHPGRIPGAAIQEQEEHATNKGIRESKGKKEQLPASEKKEQLP